MTTETAAKRYALPPEVEDERVRSLEQLQIMDSPPEERFARITEMARCVFGVPMAAVALVGRDRQWFKQVDGLDIGVNIPRGNTVCQATIARSYQHPAEPALIIEDVSAEPDFAEVPGVGEPGGIRFYAGYPLYGPGGHAIGTFCIYDTEPRTLDSRQIEAFRQMAAMVQRELGRSDDLERAATVQRQLLPRPLGDLPGYTLRSLFIPAYAVGGDFYDFYPVRGGIIVSVADVMGKGLGAAIVAATVRSALRAASLAVDQPGSETDVADTITAVSDQLVEDLASTETFVTLFHARLDTRTGTLQYVDAGHGLAVIVRKDGATELLKGDGLPLGVVAGATWVSSEVTLEPGDTLTVVSDGALDLTVGGVDIDAATNDLKEHLDPDDLCAAVRDTVDGRPPLDDITLVIIRRDVAS